MDLNAFISNPNLLPWLIPVGPLLAFVIITLLTNRSRLIPATSEVYGGHHPDYDGMLVPVVTDRSRVISIIVGMSGIVAAWLISLRVVTAALGLGHFGEDVLASNLLWMSTGETGFRMGVLVDPLTAVMLIMVPLACTMIFIYSIGYMAHDPRQSRFFSLIALFAGAMLTLVVADNLLLLFVGWEVMGLCSYMLIGFWFEKPTAYRAAIKAFTTTRVADVIMLLGIVYLYASTGTLNFRDIMYNPAPSAEGDHTLVVDAPVTEDGLVITGANVEPEPAEAEAAAGEHVEESSEETHIDAVVAGEGGEETEHAEESHAVDTWATRLGATPALILGGWGISAASLIGIFLIIGTIGKSAQFPLHVWLPDAMEGPTPVSAMIHAAAMVSAGIYAIIRMYPLLEAGGHPHDGVFTPPLLLMAFVGGFTALFAATIAVAQNDVKRVLAYSTISQLGFMVAALGIGAYIAAAFHLITHAFFKALLFMASGAVIHGMEHGEHHVHAHAHGHHDDEDEHGYHALPSGAAHADAGEHAVHTGEPAHTPYEPHGDVVVNASVTTDHDTAHGHGDHHDAVTGEHHSAAIGDEASEKGHAHFDPQDMMNMGGLRKTMPVTFITFLIGGLSLAGFPLITAGFWSKDEILADAWYGTTHGYGPHMFVFIMLAIAAFLTAFYTMRQLGLTFWGEPRTEEARHANLGSGRGVVAIAMTLPLIVLSFFAIFAGFVGVHPDFPILGRLFSGAGNPFHNLVGGTLAVHPETVTFNIFPVLVSFAVALGGLAAGWLMYWRKPLQAGDVDPLVSILGPLHTTLKNKYYFDELYTMLFVRPSQWFSRNVAYEFIDRGIIDGFLHLIARVGTWLGDFIKLLNVWLIDGVGDGIPELVARFGVWFRRLQTGRVQQYMLLLALAAILIGIIFALSTGVLQAAP